MNNVFEVRNYLREHIQKECTVAKHFHLKLPTAPRQKLAGVYVGSPSMIPRNCSVKFLCGTSGQFHQLMQADSLIIYYGIPQGFSTYL